jgi:nitrogen fixation protein FixH
MRRSAFVAGPLSGFHVLFALVGFFGVIVAVNATFLYFALATFSGIETPDAYQRGLQYNAVLVEAERQEALGWQGELTLERKRIELALRDAAGRPVSGATASARIGRPATNRHDSEIALAEVAAGRYAADLAGLPEGAWIADIAVHRAGAEDTPWRIRERLWLRPRD